MELKLNNTIRLTKKLGAGSFGEIFHAINLSNNAEVAVKVEPTTAKNPQLEYEAKLYQYLHSRDHHIEKGIPRVYHYGSEGEHNLMVMDLLGPSLEELFNKCERRFSMKSVLMIADQMVQRIEYLHSRHFLHRDIKPNNFLIGLGKDQGTVYMVDLGLAKRYMKSGTHIPYRENKNLTGTARYASINTHLGIEQGRRDDLESMCYVILYFLKGSLPWQNLRSNNKKDKYERIMDKKLSVPVELLCKGLPEEFCTLVTYCRNLRFEDQPDYTYVRNLLKSVFTRSGYELDYQYDWTSQRIEIEKNDTTSTSKDTKSDSSGNQNKKEVTSGQVTNEMAKKRNYAQLQRRCVN